MKQAETFTSSPSMIIRLFLHRWRQIPPGLPTMAEAAEPTKNDVINLSQRRPERKLVENPLTWWGDTPWLLWNFNYGASRAPAP